MKSGAESSFLVCISDYCTVIKECRGGNICFGTPSTRGTTRGEQSAGACVRRDSAQRTPRYPKAGEPGGGAAPPRAPGPAELLLPRSAPDPSCFPAHAAQRPSARPQLVAMRDVTPRRDTFAPGAGPAPRGRARSRRLFWRRLLVLSPSLCTSVRSRRGGRLRSPGAPPAPPRCPGCPLRLRSPPAPEHRQARKNTVIFSPSIYKHTQLTVSGYLGT